MPILRPYQEQDVKKLLSLKAAGLFNEQRTGKTPTAIMTIHCAKCSKVLVVCPKSAIPGWAKEYALWTGGRKVYQVTGTREHKIKVIETWDSGCLIISYDSLKTTSSYEGLLDKILKKKPNAVICDEAHRFKNPKSAVFAAVKKLTKIEYRYCLSGTPASGKPEEVFALLYFIDPKTYSSYWRFIDEYFKQKEIYVAYNRKVKLIDGFKPNMDTQLQNILNRISVQRKRIEVMPWLPAKDYEDIVLDLTNEQKKYLDELKEFYSAEHVEVVGTLDRLIRYRQICLAPELLELKGESPKLSWVLDYISDYQDVPTIVFTKFTSFIHLLVKYIKNRFPKYSFDVIYGDRSVNQRNKAVESFQQGVNKMLIINIDAGKEALTLDKAEAIIFTDVYPPASDIQQAEDRFVATVQERANKAHVIYRLIMKDSYDEEIYKLLEHNTSLIDLINDYKKYMQN